MLFEREPKSEPTQSAPFLELNDGHHMPRLGFGVWQVPNDEVGEPVKEALRVGYRSIDTAQGYDNEEGVGAAIRESGYDRETLFITSKLRTKSMGYDSTLGGIRSSLDKLGLDQLDLFLIHWPVPARGTYVDTWKAMIKAREDGLVRSIGVSNFLPEHIDRIIDQTGIIPAVNQLETHPRFQQRDVRDYHLKHGIRLESSSPLGHGEALKDPVINRIAKKHDRAPAQIILRWHMQEDLIAIPKSVTAERIAANFEIFDFDLDDEDMAAIARLDDPKGGRTGSDPATFNDLY
jgi:2,5-diketo-D-gluconate reductase A